MKKSTLLGPLTLLALAVTLSLGLSGAEKDKTFTGTLVDTKCYLMNHELTGNDHGPVKQCGTLCLKGGTPGGLLTNDKKFYALLAPSLALAPYVGQEVRVTGSIVSGAINASKAEVNENGNWQEIKLGAMM
jgi:hypothetical protein